MTTHKCHYCGRTGAVAREGEKGKRLCHDHLIASACNGFMPWKYSHGGLRRTEFTPEMGLELWKEREAKRAAGANARDDRG